MTQQASFILINIHDDRPLKYRGKIKTFKTPQAASDWIAETVDEFLYDVRDADGMPVRGWSYGGAA
jgi:hypothetical protein